MTSTSGRGGVFYIVLGITLGFIANKLECPRDVVCKELALDIIAFLNILSVGLVIMGVADISSKRKNRIE